MMKVWVMQGIHEGELYSSVHMTEKGCALAAIADVLEFLGVEDRAEAADIAFVDKATETHLRRRFGQPDALREFGYAHASVDRKRIEYSTVIAVQSTIIADILVHRT